MCRPSRRSNLIVSASATPNPVAAGGHLTYTISVTNSGTLAATGVIAFRPASQQVTEISASVSPGQSSNRLRPAL